MQKEKDFNNLGPWLSNLLNLRQMSVESLANEIGISRAAIYQYMNDQSRPREQVIIRMCQVLGVDAAEGMNQYTPRKLGRPYKSA